MVPLGTLAFYLFLLLSLVGKQAKAVGKFSGEKQLSSLVYAENQYNPWHQLSSDHGGCMVSSAYLRLLIFLPAILIPACASSSPAFLMMYSAYKFIQLCSIPCDPMDCSPPGSSVHWILQARILEWVAMPSSRGSFQPRDLVHISWVGRWILYPLDHLGSLYWLQVVFFSPASLFP